MSGVLVWLAVGVIGGLASMARFAIDVIVSSRHDGRFPVGTLVVNVSGAALLGLMTGVALKGEALVLAGTAGLGSYTTFSTWMFESHRLAEDGERLLLAVNVLASVALGFAALTLGRWIA